MKISINLFVSNFFNIIILNFYSVNIKNIKNWRILKKLTKFSFGLGLIRGICGNVMIYCVYKTMSTSRISVDLSIFILLQLFLSVYNPGSSTESIWSNDNQKNKFRALISDRGKHRQHRVRGKQWYFLCGSHILFFSGYFPLHVSFWQQLL